jgi:spore cortex protein
MKPPFVTQAKVKHMIVCLAFAKGVLRLNKKYLVLPLSAVMALGLTGCGNNDEATINDNDRNHAQPMGYYSNENHKGNAEILEDNDGPVTEMMDHTLGTERNNNTRLRVGNENPDNPTRPIANTDRNLLQRDNRFSNSDANYHGMPTIMDI